MKPAINFIECKCVRATVNFTVCLIKLHFATECGISVASSIKCVKTRQ